MREVSVGNGDEFRIARALVPLSAVHRALEEVLTVRELSGLEIAFAQTMRLAIVQDTWKGIPHAILIVYTTDGAKFLDNQYRDVKNVAGFDRYKPVYSINRTGWWRHVG